MGFKRGGLRWEGFGRSGCSGEQRVAPSGHCFFRYDIPRALAAPQVIRYQRLSPLVVESSALVSVGEVRPGDCLVAFSRRSLHALRREVMRRKGQEACLVRRGGAGWGGRVVVACCGVLVIVIGVPLGSGYSAVLLRPSVAS